MLGYDYPDSPVVVPDGRPVPEPALATFTPSGHPGARLPHAWLADGDSLFDRLGPELTLLRLDDDADPAPLAAEAQRRGIPLTVVDLPGVPGLRELLGEDLVLVRPDQHVAWRGGAVPDAGALLDRVLGAAVTAAAR